MPIRFVVFKCLKCVKIEEHSLSLNELETALFDLDETIEGLNIAPKTIICNSRFVIWQKEESESSITDINVLQSFKNIQYINLSSNQISDISPLLNLSFVHELNCSSNRITWIPDFTWPFLTKMNLSNNKIKTIPKMIYPSLQIINLNRELICIVKISQKITYHFGVIYTIN